MCFGKRFFGNYIIYSNGTRNYSERGNELENIAKRKFFYIPRINEKCEIAGKFTSEDGSSLDVDLSHENLGERYVLCYALKFKKDASVNGKKFNYKSMSWDN